MPLLLTYCDNHIKLLLREYYEIMTNVLNWVEVLEHNYERLSKKLLKYRDNQFIDTQLLQA